MTTIDRTDTIVALTRAIREHSNMTLSQIAEAGEYGADAGWPGFTYTTDAAEFTNRDDVCGRLWFMLVADAEEYGSGNVAEFIAGFGRADMADSHDGFDCLLAWYALETVGRFWNDRFESR